MSYVCWDRRRLHSVLDPDALQMPDAYFLATHVWRMLRRVDPRNPAHALGQISPERLLRHFLAPDAPHMQAAVLGTSGAGKSRLIRWLAAHVPESSARRVVLIQKVGTNLRGVLETILQGMEGPEFDAYRDRLQKAASGLDARTAPDEVLNQLQQSVGESSAHADEAIADEEARETREILMEELPALLGDPQFRKAMREKTAIVEELVRHAVGQDAGERERRTTRRAFHEDDLAVQHWDITETDVNRLARKMFRSLRSSAQWRRDAAEWMNRNLDDALGRLLSFSREDLGLMLRDVRRTLAAENKELVLLIEDFAKLQGVDYALLDAISVRPGNQQDGQPLCRLRSIMAMTTGYYTRIEQTLSGRMDFVVDVDLGEEEDRDRDIARIAARHLNALRHRDETIREWSREATEAAHEGRALPPLPSACAACSLREGCHAAFGAEPGVEGMGMGLYPFTAHALREMYDRTKTEGAFNPRVLLGRVLRQPLINYTEDVENGAWPPPALLTDLGAPQMPPIRAHQLQREVGPDRAGQYQALFELYGDPQTLGGVPEGIFEAFGMRPYAAGAIAEPPVGETERPAPAIDTLPAPQTAEAELPPRVRNLLDHLKRWSNGQKLSADATNALRRLLFPALKEAIDWNGAFLGETFHAGGTLFRQTSVNFQDQATQHGTAPVVLDIPRSAVLGLQGMVLFEQHKNWAFPEGGTYLTEFAEVVETLSAEIVRQLRLQHEETPQDPAPAAAELLVLNALLCGALSTEYLASRREEQIVLENILRHHDLPPGLHGPALELATRLNKEQDRLRAILMARIASTKGASTDNASMIDASRVRQALQRVTKTWKPEAALPAQPLRGDYELLAALRERVDSQWPPALAEEARQLQAELDALNQHIGPGEASNRAREAVRHASEKAEALGVWRAGTSHSGDLIRAMERFRGSKLDPIRLKAAEDKIGEARSVPLLFSPELRAEVTAGAHFVTTADQFLTRTAERVEQEIDALGSDPEADRRATEAINANLGEIVALLEALD